jgi:hypothetical protein
MATNPQGFFRFAGRYYPLLLDLFYLTEGFTEADLRDRIELSRTEGDPLSSTVVEQLMAFGIIEAIPDATASFELTAPVRGLLSFLLREHRLTSAKVIQGYLANLEELRQELDGAARERLVNQAARSLADIAQLIERIRQDSHANREAIIGEVLNLKSNREQRSMRERFEIINRLWTRYLEPLRDLIDVKKAMDAGLDDLERGLRQSGQVFSLDGALAREFSRCRARLLRLRRDVAEDFRESLREVEPLYVSLKQESTLVRGASLALERLDRSGIGSLQLDALFTLPTWRVEGLFSDTSLASFFHGIYGYEPVPPKPIPVAENKAAQEFIQRSELFSRLDTSLPLDDLLDWLLDQYPDAGMGELVKAYGLVYLGHTGQMHFGKMEKRYELGEATLISRPVGLEKAS